MSPWRAGCGSASITHILIRKDARGDWNWTLTVHAHEHAEPITATGGRKTWGEAFSAAREECMWWVR